MYKEYARFSIYCDSVIRAVFTENMYVQMYTNSIFTHNNTLFFVATDSIAGPSGTSECMAHANLLNMV